MYCHDNSALISLVHVIDFVFNIREDTICGFCGFDQSTESFVKVTMEGKKTVNLSQTILNGLKFMDVTRTSRQLLLEESLLLL